MINDDSVPVTFFDRLSRTRNSVLLSAVAVAAFAIRVLVSYRAVFGQEYVAFIENDAWYHMRLVDGLIRHFPWRIWADAYQVHPGGDYVDAGPMFDWIVAGTALVLGGGAPSERLVDLVGAFIPPLIGALTVFPLYALGKELFSKRAGLIAAVSIAVMPGETMIRSLLGFTDHHCAEVLFSTLTLLFMVRALDPLRTPSSRIRQAWAAGAMLGIYLLTWAAGAMLVATITVWAGLEMLAARFRSNTDGSIVRAVTPAFGVAAIMIAPWTSARFVFTVALVALGGGLTGIILLHGLDQFTRQRRRGTQIYFATIAAVVVAASIAIVFVSSLSLDALLSSLARMSPLRTAGLVSEATPLMRSPDWRPFPLWNQFTTSLIFSIVALPWVIRHDARKPQVRLVLAWGLFSLLATVGQVRFAYYLAVGVALLAGRGADVLLSWLPVRRPILEPAVMTLLVIALAAPGAPVLASQARSTTTLTADWFDALQWMRTNTPEPFDDPDAYFRDGIPEPEGYGVLSWWDYGYWIARVARRPPVTNPRQTQVVEAAGFFTAADATAAHDILDKTDTRYVIVDALTQMSTTRSPAGPGFFEFIASTAQLDPSTYCQAFIPPASADRQPLLYCFPEYYKTMAVRLYAFGGRAVTPQSVLVIDVAPSQPGQVRQIRRETLFSSYDAAAAFAHQRPAGERLVVSKDLLSSPVPLEAMPELVRVFQSVGTQRPGGPSLVQVFEYRR